MTGRLIVVSAICCAWFSIAVTVIRGARMIGLCALKLNLVFFGARAASI